MKRHSSVSRSSHGSALSSLVTGTVWVAGVLVALAVGFGMIGDEAGSVLSVPWIPDVLVMTAGWIVVVLTIIGAALALIEAARK